MFKKLKDKIAEEVKQSPLKFPTSVQQFTQSVSPSLSLTNNLSIDENTTSDNGGNEATDSHELEHDNSFTTIDLRSPVTPKTRRSSSSSINSDLFPVYEFPRQLILQSDLESCSEFDDGSSIHQFNNVTKENLYEKYRTALQKYHKYRGRFSDVQKYCKELQRELNKAKNVLTETQDKAIRRIFELKEQCSLEQKAKAHLEDTLRNELEERDHLINTLNTKIELLKSGKNHEDDDTSIAMQRKSLPDLQNEETNTSETDTLKEKIQKFETLLNNAKDAITSKTMQIKDLQAKAEVDKNNLKSALDRVASLEESINLMKGREEEASLSLAENKLHVHQELEFKESQIRTLSGKITELNEELKKLKTSKPNADKLSSEIKETHSDLKDEKYESLKHEIQLLTASRITDQNSIAEKDRLIQEFKTAVDSSNQELLRLQNEMEAPTLFSRIEDSDLKSVLKQTEATARQLESSLAEKQREFETTIQQLTDNKEQLELKVQELEQKLSVVKTEKLEKDALCESLEDKLASLTSQFKKRETELAEKERLLVDKLDEVRRLTAELGKANTKIKEHVDEKKVWTETEAHLKADKIVLEEKMKSIRKELSTAQTELKNVKSTVSEKDMNEKKKLERQLADSENELARLRSELEQDKETEHEMMVRTACLLEEINSFKTKDDHQSQEIRTLRTDIQNLRDKLTITEGLKTESNKLNADLNVKIEQLQAEISDMRKLENEIVALRNDLTNCKKENDDLKAKESEYSIELEQLRRSNQEMSDIKQKFDSLQQKLLDVNSMKEDLLREKNTSLVEIKRLEIECNKLMTELENIRSWKNTIEKQNEELMRESQSNHHKYKMIEEEANEAKIKNEHLSQQIEALKLMNAEGHSKSESLLQATNAYKRLEEEYLRTQKYVEHFLKDLKPVLENCIVLKKRLVREETRNQNLIRQIAIDADSISRLETQLSQLTSKDSESSFSCDKEVLYSLKNCITSLKNEHVRVRNEIFDEFNSLKLYCMECDQKVKNGPMKLLQDNINYISELENRLSDIEPLCERLKRKVLDYETENRQLLGQVQELSSNSLNGTHEGKAEITNMSETEEVVQNAEKELALKQEALEKLSEKQQRDANGLNNELSEIKEEHARALREIDKRWRSCLDKKVQELEEKHKAEIDELTKGCSANSMTLEKYATGNEDAEALKKQVELLSNELCNYKKLHWKDIELDGYRDSANSELSLEDCTELEYLRNILFEYMMGHQPLVLAKVLAAVVKFDSDQTQQVLHREEQKLTLLGHLGLP